MTRTQTYQKGYISAKIQGTSSAPVKFDDFSIQLKSLYSAKLYQENHYYPFGMNMKGLENEDFQTVQNKDEHLWQYNGKERQDDFDLFWLDYGARNYDAQVGRWHSVDPLAEKYDALSPFVYCGNNPIRFIDPNGMEFTEGSWEYVDVYMDHLNNRITKEEEKIAQREKDGKKTKGARARLKRYKKERDVVRFEIGKLIASDQVYDISKTTRNNVDGVLPGTGEYRSGVTFDFDTNIFKIELSDGKDVGMIAHELKHAYQFEIGEYSSGYPTNVFGSLLYDQEDEHVAYDRGGLLSKRQAEPSNFYSDDLYGKLPKGPIDINNHPSIIQILHADATKQQKEKLLQTLSNQSRQAFRVNKKTYVPHKKYLPK